MVDFPKQKLDDLINDIEDTNSNFYICLDCLEYMEDSDKLKEHKEKGHTCIYSFQDKDISLDHRDVAKLMRITREVWMR